MSWREVRVGTRAGYRTLLATGNMTLSVALLWPQKRRRNSSSNKEDQVEKY